MFKKIIHFPFYAFLLGLFPIIALWNNNKSQIYAKDVWLSIGISAAFVVAVWLLSLLIFRSATRASLTSSLLFILFFSYGHVYNFLKNALPSFGFLKLAAVYAILLVLVVFVAVRVRKISSDITLWLNGIFTLLVLFNAVQIIAFEVSVRRDRSAETTSQVQTATATESDLPDIYYIILDSYSRQDVLKDAMGYDNSAFIDALRERGFYIPECANSNYDSTVDSIASALNYSYVDNPTSEDETSSVSLKDNKIRQDLAAYGYLFVTDKGFSSEDDVNNSDIYLNYLKDAGIKDTVMQAQFTRMYFETTLLRVMFEYYYMDPVRYSNLPQWLFISEKDDKVLGYASFWFNQTNYVFDQLATFPEKPGNYLIYAHINLPHQPFVYDANGNFKYTYNPPDDQMTAPYLDQISYANKRVLQLVDELIKNSKTPPIIIIQGDHGAHVITSGLEKHKILNAYYVPQEMKDDLYPTITPVNTFRLILRDVFGKEIDLLPDTLYVKFTNDYEAVPSTCTIP